ncbi:MAG: NTP transferase domain-containing protein [Acidimicrobiales bacterium]
MGQRRPPLGGLTLVGSGPVLVVLAAGRARRYGGVKPLAPVGPAGEAVIDLLASDAMRAGFATLVLVVGPESGPAIRYHVERMWPRWVDVHFALQDAPLGTVHAVLSATDHLVENGPFGVANADDCYGVGGLTKLVEHLSGPAPDNALVTYRLRDAVIGTAPVSRGICEVGDEGALRSLVERRNVTPTVDGRFVVADGREPVEIDGDVLVSMNLWGFNPDIRGVLQAAMDRGLSSSADAEILLPDVVGQALAATPSTPGSATRFQVLPAGGRCVGVTHPDDLPLVQRELAGQVGRGERSATLWPVGT